MAAILAPPLASVVADDRIPALASTEATSPIRSQVELDAYLRAQAGKPTPFDALPPGARERFLLSLDWGETGLASFDPDVLADELPQPQIDALLQLFGDDIVGYTPRSRRRDEAATGPAPTTTATGGIGALERRYNDFYRTLRERNGLDDAAFAARIAERFDTLLHDAYAAETLRNVDDRHLAMLWNASALTSRLSHAPRHAATMEAVLAETARRTAEPPPPERLREMRNTLLAARRFEHARSIARQYPDSELQPLPDFIDPLPGHVRAHTAWIMSADGSSLARNPIDLSGTRILVTAGCHFSQDAAEDIANDPVLGPAFAAYASWLMLPPGDEDIDAIREWNMRFPQAPARMIYSRAEWPMFPHWPMPEFHVVRDGRIVETVTGWPRGKDSNRKALIELLRRAELLGPGAAPLSLVGGDAAVSHPIYGG